VFAGWYGGYLNGDSWKLSSGITSVEEFEDRFEFMNYSGSLYVCRKDSKGMGGYMGQVYTSWLANLPEDTMLELVDKYEDTPTSEETTNEANGTGSSLE
jgi:hypothetical protein